MLRRCYSPTTQERSPTYIGCSVATEWHDFQVFAEWYNTKFFEGTFEWELDKDILEKGNKIYSPKTCIPLPSELNCLLIKSEKTRGEGCIGVNWHSRDKIFQASCNANNKSFYLGYYTTEIEAFNAYKTFKEAFIKQQALKWKDQIDPRAFNALMAYEVLITD